MNNIEKKFYTLKELSPLVNVKYRQLQKKIKSVSIKYCDRKDLIYKKSNKWNIHTSLIKEFTRKRKPINYKLFITISSQNNLGLSWWKLTIHELNKSLKKVDASSRVKYVIEKNKKNIYHLHFITNFYGIKKLRSIIKNNDITYSYVDMNMNMEIKYIYNIKKLHKYFKKQNKPVLLK